MVSSMVGGWGCPGRCCRRGALALGCPRLLGIPRYGVSGGWRLGGVYGPFLARPAPSALQAGQGRWAFDSGPLQAWVRAPRGVARGGSGRALAC